MFRQQDGGSSGNIVQIQDNNYIFDVYLWNGETKTGITFAAIDELKIVDDLRYFYCYGYMLFNDSNDILETFNGDGKIKPYNFRGDGRDYLNIEIMPQIRNNDVFVQEVSEKDRKEFCLKYTFSIYKVEEDVKEDRGTKFKKIFFWDCDYQMLNEIDSHFSTSEVGFDKIQVTDLKNTNDPKRYTGDSLKYLLDKCLNKISKSGFKASKEWDKGGSLIEYHTNSGYKAIDDIQYFLEYHVSDKSNNYVPCILKKERYTEEYSFIPITTYIKNAIYKTGNILGSVIGGEI